MNEKIPLVTVTCFRDLPLLDLQAQGIFHHLDKSIPLYLIINEDEPKKWFDFFNENIRHYYQNHNLTILLKSDFSSDWHHWIPSKLNPWAVGWETQQVLKICVANRIKEKHYLILDSQNFLIRAWSTDLYASDKTPARSGPFSMPIQIWDDYCKTLDVKTAKPKGDTLSQCTPIFFNTKVTQKLIEYTGGESKFAEWFKSASRIKSEFVLYTIWLEKMGGMNKFHNMVQSRTDWGNPYLRDCRTEEEFNAFIDFIGVHEPHAWVSANHRAWGNMTSKQYLSLSNKLANYKLTPHFDDYRSSYVDLKF